MSEPGESTHEPDDGRKSKRPPAPITRNRVIIWVLAGGFGLYMIGTGLVGILTK